MSEFSTSIFRAISNLIMIGTGAVLFIMGVIDLVMQRLGRG
jgi:hypothetical protein